MCFAPKHIPDLIRCAPGSTSALLISAAVLAAEPSTADLDDPLPYAQRPIHYDAPAIDNAAARLQEQLDAGTAVLPFHERFGYLPGLLQQLDVPIESQLLVFSKTALHSRLVSPRTPRAVYFNDEVSVGYVPGTPAIEVAAIDPDKGVTFWVLEQNAQTAPRLVRESSCLACHVGQTTLHVPGLMVRSFLTDDAGNPLGGYSRITHETELSKRFGGWYVTGKHGTQPHWGNLIGRADEQRQRRQPLFRGNVTELPQTVDASAYLSPHSDLVAHLVLNHQAHGVNLLVRAGYEHRLNRRSDAEDRLLRYLVFADEPPLTAPLAGTSGFARWFEQRGPKDEQGRSLREFDLRTRVFRYRLSCLIYSPAFDGLPGEVKSRLYQRLYAGLTAETPPADFRHLPLDERQAIVKIVRATKCDLPPGWR